MGAPALALLLSDARFPSGSHAHSGGVEEACDRAWIHDGASLDRYLRGRLDTTGTVAAHLAAAVCARLESGSDPAWLWPAADAEADARMASPAARAVSRQQGGQLLRTAVQVLDVGDDAGLASLASEQQRPRPGWRRLTPRLLLPTAWWRRPPRRLYASSASTPA